MNKDFKNFNEMTDQELVEVMKQLNDEKAAREKAAEERRKAEEEAKRQAEEAERLAKAEKEEDELVEKQKSVLGKCFKHTGFDKHMNRKYTIYYKVVGVYENTAMVSTIKEYDGCKYASRTTDYIGIDTLLSNDGYMEASTREEFNQQYDNVVDGISSFIDSISNLWQPLMF